MPGLEGHGGWRVGSTVAWITNGMSSGGGPARTMSVRSAEIAGGPQTLLRSVHGQGLGRPTVSSRYPGLRRLIHGPGHTPGRLLATLVAGICSLQSVPPIEFERLCSPHPVAKGPSALAPTAAYEPPSLIPIWSWCN